ncbi:MAG: glycosyltransferase, partial [bacterium]|nr:glycosyltransferase [bacterium]
MKILPKNRNQKFLLVKKALEEGSSVSFACKKVGISRVSYYRWLKKQEERGGKKEERREEGRVKSENLILKLALSHPEWTIQKLTKKVPKSTFFVWKVLNKKGLGARRMRKKQARHAQLFPTRKQKYLATFGTRVLLLDGADKKGISFACREFNVSRTLYYKWKKRQANGEILEDKKWQVARWGRQTPEKYEKMILDMVAKKPALSVHRLFAQAPRVTGVPVVGYHGIQNILRRNNLNTYGRRLEFSRAPSLPILPTTPSWLGRLKSVWDTFVPQLAPAPPPSLALRASPLLGLRENLAAYLRPFALSFASSTAFSLLLITWFSMMSSQPLGMRFGLFFASVALLMGMFFFLYSMKYYFTLALVLSFSSQGEGDQKVRTSGSWLARVFGLNGTSAPLSVNGKAEIGGTKIPAPGLQQDLSHVKLERYPFISVHLPLYNEKKVANRLISACTSFDYPSSPDGSSGQAHSSTDDSSGQTHSSAGGSGQAPNYEVIVCDDSTDETVEIVNSWANNPKVKILHRPTRTGFKGGALAYATQAMDPRTEFVIVFDADFVPYPDTLIQFMKYFKASGAWDEKKFCKAESIQTMPYRDFKEEFASWQERETFKKQEEELRAKNDVAVVAGYQWHVLNKSENWITRGVRTEYAGSYVIERPGQEILGALKIIHGSVYCMRADVLKHFGWGTSITEDFELTLRLYEKGFRVIFTPYIQAPSECVSTIKRLIRQRMRWAEGHSFNTKRMFLRLLFGHWEQLNPKFEFRNSKQYQNSISFENLDLENSNLFSASDFGFRASGKKWVPSPLTFSEKTEFLYLAPYYLQAFFFLVGTFAWLLSETVFGARLPFWTSIWGWSLVLTNLLAMPLVNAVGLFLEESEEKDYLGLLSFIALCYIVVPFQAYAAVKGFIESSEGPWFRTPKTGLVTDVFARGRVYRWLTGFLSWKPATGGIAHARLAEAPVFEAPFGRYLALATANNQFNRLRMRPKQIRGLANLVIVCLVLVSVVLSFVAIPMGTTLAFDGLFYFRPRGADVVDTTAATPRRQMSTGSVGTSTGSVTLGAGADVGNTAYFHDTQAGSVSIPTAVNATASAAATDATLYGSQRHLHRDKQGNMILIFINSSGDIRGSFKTASSSAVWTPVDLELETHSSTYTNTSVSSALDNKGNIHMAYEASNGTGTSIYFKRVAVGRDSNGVVQRTGWSVGTEVSLAGAAGTNTYINPSL